jgi:hypothetical protein
MSEASHYCDFCGAQIRASDLEKGRAIILMKKRFCGGCLEKAVEKGRQADKKEKAHDSHPSNVLGASR